MFKIERNSLSPPYTAQIMDRNENIIDLRNTASVKLRLVRGTYELAYDMSITDAVYGKVKYQWMLGDTNYLGLWKVWITVNFLDGSSFVWPDGSEEFLLFISHEGGEIPPEIPADEYMRKSTYDVNNNTAVDVSEESISPKKVTSLPDGEEGEFVYNTSDGKFYIKVKE